MMLAVSVALPQPGLTGAGGAPPPPAPPLMNASTSDAGSGLIFVPSFDIPVATNRLLVVELVWNEDLGEMPPPPAVSYNAVPLTLIAGSNQAAGAAQSAVYVLVAPATGAHDLEVEFEMPVNYRAFIASWRDVDPATPLGATAGSTGTGTAPSTTVSPAPPTTSQLVDHLLASLGTSTTSATKHASQTQLDNALVGTSPTRMRQAASSKADGGATMSWTLAASKPWALFAYELRRSA